MLVCPHCLKEFEPWKVGVKQVFCGHRCAMLSYHSKRLPKVAAVGVPHGIRARDPKKFSRDASGQWWYTSGRYRLKTEIRKCEECGVEFLAAHNRESRQTSYCSRKCGVKATYRGMDPADRRYANARAYKGGRQYRGGYVFVLVPPDHPGVQGTTKRYLPEHRLVMEQVLGRRLGKTEQVHHKNGVRDDNRPENLELWVRRQPSGQRAHEQQHCPTCTCFRHE
jgi:hypothetical protein